MSFLSVNLLANVIGTSDYYMGNKKKVAIYNGTKEVMTGNAIFDTAVLQCSVTDDSQLMEHPVESGVKITDHQIFNPIEIDIRLAMPTYFYSKILEEMKTLYKNGTLLSIKTVDNPKMYSNMVLQAIPHEETPDNIDRLVFDLHFKEVLIVEPVYITLPEDKVENPQNSSTKTLGENITKKEVPSSILADGIKAIGGLF